jgi:hypothetical protein
MDHYGRVDAASSSLDKGYRYPGGDHQPLRVAVSPVPVSFREVEEMIPGGVIVSYETIRAWRRTFGQAFATSCVVGGPAR